VIGYLIPELGFKVKLNYIEPDGTFRDDFYRHRGYWEAKDTHDNLAAEVRKKIARGYPLTNTIFEDTRQALLYQNGELAQKADLTKPRQLCDLLNAFFGYTEPALESFDHAIDEFKERIPDLARGLVEKIVYAHEHNRAFIEAFQKFFDLCKASLNPNLRREAVDEMLVQHLLTERLIRTIFDQPDFVRRNIIAAEVEKLIDALTSQNFSRNDFLKSLDRFYIAIEESARTIQSFSDKQHFLNTLYERFFKGYSIKDADKLGIVYTPQEIVDFMSASVVELLEKEFGKKLGDPDVFVLDPCTGTGNFIVNLLGRVKKADLAQFYREQLFANEVMLLPYYIASLNIEHAHYELAGGYDPFDGICFVDTLDLAEEQGRFKLMAEANTERVERQKKAPITVVIGNPPYNANQINEWDNNRNRKYPVVDSRVRATYAKDSEGGLKNKLYDPYVKFLRWATDRLQGSDGIVCMITNNNFVIDKFPFDGVRKRVVQEFTDILHLDLHGNARRDLRLSGSSHNVFGIPLGVGITIAIRNKEAASHTVRLFRVPERWKRTEKLRQLAKWGSAYHFDWSNGTPCPYNSWIQYKAAGDFDDLIPLATKAVKMSKGLNGNAVFKKYSVGIKSNRDEIVFDFQRRPLLTRMEQFIESYNSHVDRLRRAKGPVEIDDFVSYQHVKWDGTLKQHLQRFREGVFDERHIRQTLYRPFTTEFLYFDPLCINRVYLQPRIFPTTTAERENAAICCTNHAQTPFVVLISNRIPNEAVGGRAGQCFPFYFYGEDGGKRRENITDWALDQFRKHYKSQKLDKWDIFHCVYSLLHHPGYRERYANELKREIPRIPFVPDFKSFAAVGKQLADLHLGYEELSPYKLERVEGDAVPLSYRVERMKLAKDKRSLVVNESLTLAGIPAETFDYRLGTRSALDWVVAQYRVTTDELSGITSDPNRDDDPEYIVRLIGQVIRVSVETVDIVNRLAALPFREE